jgi:hypothetical protein
MQATGDYRVDVFTFSEGKLSLHLLSRNIFRQRESTFFHHTEMWIWAENYGRLWLRTLTKQISPRVAQHRRGAKSGEAGMKKTCLACRSRSSSLVAWMRASDHSRKTLVSVALANLDSFLIH